MAKKDAAGHYVDKNGAPIPEINGHIDASQIVWVSNTGVRVSSLVNDWLSQPILKANKYLHCLTDTTYTDNKAQNVVMPSPCPNAATESVQINNTKPMKNIEVTPANNRSGITVNININLDGTATSPAPLAELKSPAGDDGFESKVTDEQNKDYSNCNGFDEYFMGVYTPLPTLGEQLARKAASLIFNPSQFVLKYQHYSTIVHSIRRMPIISAINVQGDPSVRQDNAARKDNWLRDNRIDLEVQLTDAYYKSSGFDKGHMSRREDAKWGDSPADAEEAAQLTCMYSNACPQVPNINRAVYGYHGLWGQLEQIVLEKGVEAESGDASKICVYNGPVFVDTDPTYKGVQVPMRFFKIVVWRNGAGDMKTTAFVLSQENLVDGIQFEELQYDKEFIEHQCSIAYLENLTQLTFAGINQYDTSPNKDDKNAVATVDRAAVEAHISGHAK